MSEESERMGNPVRDLIGYGNAPVTFTWPESARVAVNFVLNYEEGSERSFPDGDGRNETLGEREGELRGARDLRMESVHEYGSRVGVWRLLRLFEDHGQIPLTLFATAMAVERNPALAAYLRSTPRHEVCGHGYRWSEAWLMTREEEREQISRAITSLEETTGRRPRGWCSRNTSSVHTRELLVELGGFLYDSDAYNDDLPYFTDVHPGKRHLVIPYTVLHNDIRYVSGQGFSSPDDFYRTCELAFDYLWEEGQRTPRMMSIGLHARWAGQPARAAAVARLVRHMQDRGYVWFTTRAEIAEFWLEQFGAEGT